MSSDLRFKSMQIATQIWVRGEFWGRRRIGRQLESKRMIAILRAF